MSHEIADSDEEVDYETTPVAPAPVAFDMAAAPASIAAQLSYEPFDVNFDAFLTQSGRTALSQSQKERGIEMEASQSRSTGSTQKLLRGLEDVQRELAVGSSSSRTLSAVTVLERRQGSSMDSPTDLSRKRRHTGDDGMQEWGRLKRTKTANTYERNRGHLSSSQSSVSGDRKEELNALQQPADAPTHPQSANDQTADRDMSMQPPSATSREQVDDNDDNEGERFVRQRNRPRRVTSLLNGKSSESSAEVSTARSSMGGYESININFRGSVSGIDINANPFGSLSQILAGDEVDSAESEKLASIFTAGAALAGRVSEFNNDIAQTGVDDLDGLQHASTGLHATPERSQSIKPSLPTNNFPKDAPNSSQPLSSAASSSHKRQKAANSVILSDSSPDIIQRGSASILKQTGRRLKDQRLERPPEDTGRNDTNAIAPEDVTNGRHDKVHKPEQNRSLSRTVDTDNGDGQAAGDVKKVTASRRRTGSRLAKNNLELSAATEESPTPKHPADEPSLSDDAFVGLPKENYKPRPSHSRRVIDESLHKTMYGEPDFGGTNNRKTEKHAMDQDGHENIQNESSPAKQPRNDLNFGDEVGIDLPKENYIPQPSRSRSKKIVDDDETVTSKDQESSLSRIEIENEASPPKTRKKKGKKTKVKRAKTSAAALMRKSEQMLSEGEEDVIFMDKQPAKVKLDLPPDIKLGSGMKQEVEEKILNPTTEIQVQSDKDGAADDEKKPEAETTNPRLAAFSTEVPSCGAVAKGKSPPEPKKRSRKCKKTAEAPTDEAILTDPPLAEIASAVDATATISSQSKTRLALDNLNPNFASHFHPSEPKAHTPSPPKVGDEEQENNQEPQATPLKAHAPPPPSSSPTKPSDTAKGPTKHSPINSLASMAKYRVGLSRRAPIPSLLKIVRKDRPVLVAPKAKRAKVKGRDVEPEAEVEDAVKKGGHDEDEHYEHDQEDREAGSAGVRRDPETGLLVEYVSD